MYERLSQMAEQAASQACRRQFLGALGRAALGAAAAAAAILVSPGTVSARPVHLCSDFSGICANQPVNSFCSDYYGPGRCRKIRGTNDCHCYTGR
jgi:hypothetical protein